MPARRPGAGPLGGNGSRPAEVCCAMSALTGLDVLPFEERYLQEALKSRLKPELMELNLEAFSLGRESVKV